MRSSDDTRPNGRRAASLAVDDAPASFRDGLRAALWGMGASVAGLGSAVGVSVALGATPASDRVSTAALFGAFTSIALVALVLRRKLGGRAGAIASLATLAWIPFIALGVMVTSGPVVSTHTLCGTGQLELALLAAIVFVPFFGAVGSLATLARFPKIDLLVRAAAIASLFVIVPATVRALPLMRCPDPNTFVASLPVVQTLRVGDSFVLTDGTKLTYATATPPSEVARCHLVGVEAFADLDCGPLPLRHDVKSDVWLVGNRGSDLAFTAQEKRSRDIYPSDLTASLGPPVGWTLGAALGLAGEIALLAYAWTLQRRRARYDGVEATVGADGWVVAPGRPPLQVPGMGGAPGPIVLQFRKGPLGPQASYREVGSDVLEGWRCGTLEDARAALAGRITTFYALALTTGLLCAAPLLAGWR